MMTFKQQKKQLLQDFDFKTVQRVMGFLDWVYCGATEPPTIDELKKLAECLLDDIYKSPEHVRWVASGGFKAERFGENGKPYFELSFIVEHRVSFEH